MSTVQTVVGKFVWHENYSNDPDSARNFYNQLFGWKTQSQDMGEIGTYTIFKRAGDADVGGAIKAPEGAPTSWLPYIATDDVDGAAARTKELGGTVIQEATDIPNMG